MPNHVIEVKVIIRLEKDSFRIKNIKQTLTLMGAKTTKLSFEKMLNLL